MASFRFDDRHGPAVAVDCKQVSRLDALSPIADSQHRRDSVCGSRRSLVREETARKPRTGLHSYTRAPRWIRAPGWIPCRSRGPSRGQRAGSTPGWSSGKPGLCLASSRQSVPPTTRATPRRRSCRATQESRPEPPRRLRCRSASPCTSDLADRRPGAGLTPAGARACAPPAAGRAPPQAQPARAAQPPSHARRWPLQSQAASGRRCPEAKTASRTLQTDGPARAPSGAEQATRNRDRTPSPL